MDANGSELNQTPADLTALTQRVAELERLVGQMRAAAVSQPAVPAERAPRQTAAVPPPPPPPMVVSPADPAAQPPVFRFAGPSVTPPTTLPRQQPPAKSLEDRLGSQIFPLIGAFAILCAAAYFLKLAIDRGWLNPTARVAIGLLAGAGIILGSETLRRKKMLAFSYVLKAVGSAILYLSLWAGFQLYHLLPAPAALTAMILVTAWNAWMAVTQDAELLAGYALAGGLLTPVLVSSGGNHETFLFTYLAAIALGVVYLLRTKTWVWLLLPTFLGVAGYFMGWYSEFFHDRTAEVWNGASTETALFALVFFVLFALPTVKGWSSLPDPAPGSAAALVPVLLPFANATCLALALYSVFEDSGLHSSLAFLMVALAALFLGMMRLQRAVISTAMFLATAVVCLTVAVPLKAHGHSLTTAWLVEGLILYWASTRFAEKPVPTSQPDQAARKQDKAPQVVLWVLSLGGYVLGLGSLVAHWGLAAIFDEPTKFFSSNLAAAMVAVAALAGAAWLAHQRGEHGVEAVPLLAIDGVALLLAFKQIFSWGDAAHHAFANPDFATSLLGLATIATVCYAAFRVSGGRSPIAAGNFILANLVAVLIVVREIGALFSSTDADLERSLAISAFLMLYGAALLSIGFVKHSAFVRWQALALLIFTIGKVFLYDISGLSAGYRVASFLGLGAVLMGVSYAYQKDWLGLKTTPHEAPPPVPQEVNQ